MKINKPVVWVVASWIAVLCVLGIVIFNDPPCDGTNCEGTKKWLRMSYIIDSVATEKGWYIPDTATIYITITPPDTCMKIDTVSKLDGRNVMDVLELVNEYYLDIDTIYVVRR